MSNRAEPKYNEIEAFLIQYSRWITPAQAERLRVNFEKAIQEQKYSLRSCPEDLRERLQIVINETLYRKRCNGSKMKLKEATEPHVGRSYHRQSPIMPEKGWHKHRK